MLKSILYQLSKYTPQIPEAAKIEVPEQEWDPEIVAILNDLYPDGEWPYAAPTNVASILLCPDKKNPPKWVGILYPKSVYIAYELYRYLGAWSNETRTDELFAGFFLQADRSAFSARLSEACDDTVIKLAMSRVVLATFDADPSHKPQDRLPVDPYRASAANMIGLNPLQERLAVAASEILIGTSNHAATEQLILGRLAYLAIWYSNKERTQPAFTGKLSTLYLGYEPDANIRNDSANAGAKRTDLLSPLAIRAPEQD